MSSLWIPGPLPGLNEIIAAASRRRGKWNAYADMKRQWGGVIRLLAQAQRVSRIETKCFTYLFIEPNKRRDPSNIFAGGIKLIEDALQEAELLENDGWKNVEEIAPYVSEPIRGGSIGAFVVFDECTHGMPELVDMLQRRAGMR